VNVGQDACPVETLPPDSEAHRKQDSGVQLASGANGLVYNHLANHALSETPNAKRSPGGAPRRPELNDILVAQDRCGAAESFVA